jgi:broad specificity phosphatase PhoE
MSAPARVLLIRHAPTAATRRHAFPTDEPLDVRGRAAAAALRGRLPVRRAVTAPARRCRQTASLAGFEEPRVDPRWSELDFGAWSGLTLAEVGEQDPQRLAEWLADPRTPPPDGEPLTGLVDRVGAALADLCRPGTTTAVFTSAGPVKAALLAVIAAPLESLWRVDVMPCAVTVLHGHPPQWTIRTLNAWPLDEEDRPETVESGAG